MDRAISSADDEEQAAITMRCAGCGGKVAGSVLSRVLERLDIPPSEHVLLGLDRPDDAAIIRSPGGRPLTLTVDFFAAPLDDPYLVGRIAALNAASDLFAMGAKPQAALAMVTMPVGKPSQQEELLYQLLAGSLAEFRKMGATLVGGHTIEGPQLAIGFTMIGDQGERPPRTKDRLRAGDVLLLTKPLGTGVLLAAHMKAWCQAAWTEPMLDSMLASNQPAAELLDEFDIDAVTDVTGFGLAGHLLEMLQASRLSAELQLDQIPLLPGANTLLEAGWESTLAPANRMAEDHIDGPEAFCKLAGNYLALFDPQTSGGLLIAVSADRAEAFRQRLNELGVTAAQIGTIIDDDRAQIRLR
jgi:selenide,water dikinase